ncbi:uncharacterized protein BDV14DRAFT_206464 [Aspergillus stella-maris]|uniref:uncharacterized protein n=1 Tax=Aspergillus stella-maris TaxID=1810926 RepID=UPI003CCD54D9
MKVATKETFGPVAALARFSTKEVVRRANNCYVGLASYLNTSGLGRPHRVTERLKLENVKHSGTGREGSKYGVDDYLNIKMVVTAVLDDLR